MRHRIRGQGAVETLIFTAIILVIITGIVYIAFDQITSTKSLEKSDLGRAALSDLASSGYAIDQGGVKSRDDITITLPSGATELSISGNTMTLIFEDGTSIVQPTDYIAHGTVPVSRGKNVIPVQSLKKGICFGDLNYCTICGDSVIEGWEECEGADVNGKTCITEGFASGPLGCTSTCTLDTSACIPPICGNNIKETGEVCDGTDLGGQTCYSQGFWIGQLKCNPNCMGFNTSACQHPQSFCLGIGYLDATLDAADNRIHNIELSNSCNRTLYVTGANISWIGAPSNLLEAVQIDGSVKWTFNCNWGCIPSGRQPSGTAVYFSGTNTLLFKMPPMSTFKVDKIDWKNSIQGIPVQMRFILNDSSYNQSVYFNLTN